MMRLSLLLLSLCCSVSAWGAQALQPVRLQLKWTHQFQFAGYYAAQAQGFYREAGLEVSLLEARPGQDPVATVLNGQAEFGVGTSDLLLHRARGQPVVVLAVIFQHSPLALMALERSGIRNIHEVAGRRLMIEDNSAELFAYLEREGIPRGSLNLVPHSFGTAELSAGTVDAQSVYITDEPFVFAQAGVNFSLFTPRSGGIDFYGDNLFTTESYLRTHPAVVEAFREASLRGWVYAMGHPTEIVDLIIQRYSQRKTREQLLYEYEQMRPLLRNELIAVGYMYPGRWRHIADVYAEQGMLPAGIALTGFLYDPQRLHIPPWVYWWVGGALLLTLSAGSISLYILRIDRRLSLEMERRRQTEWSLKASQQHYQLIYETAPLALILFDREHRVIDWNRAAERIFGWPRIEMLGVGLERMVPAADLDYVAKVMEQAWEGGLVGGVNRNLTRDGRTILCRWSNVLQRDGHGEPGAVLSLAQDITEAERIRADLEAANQALHTQIRQIEGLQEDLREQARRDPLTGLYNRRYLELVLQRELTQSRDQPLSLVMIDIDRFKEVNDTLGHQAGDQVLTALARILTSTTRASDIACRFGGEEFTVVLPGAALEVAYAHAESWRKAFSELLIQADTGEVRRTLSAGVAAWPAHAAEPGGLLGAADRALYAAKAAGRNRTIVAPIADPAAASALS